MFRRSFTFKLFLITVDTHSPLRIQSAFQNCFQTPFCFLFFKLLQCSCNKFKKFLNPVLLKRSNFSFSFYIFETIAQHFIDFFFSDIFFLQCFLKFSQFEDKRKRYIYFLVTGWGSIAS